MSFGLDLYKKRPSCEVIVKQSASGTRQEKFASSYKLLQVDGEEIISSVMSQLTVDGDDGFSQLALLHQVGLGTDPLGMIYLLIRSI